jgi:hypothetical protein
MKVLLRNPGHSLLRKILVLSVLMTLLAPFQAGTTFAAGKCQTSGPASAAYTLTVCITAPADGATVSGSRAVNTTVTVNGTDPGVSKLVFYLAGEYLITDYQSPFTFALVTTKWVDGRRLLEVETVMRDGFASQRASITLNFSNGIVQPPVNNNTFTPRRGTTPPGGQAFTLVATGDGADGATHAANVTDLIASWNPNLFLYLGDVYDEGTATEFRNWYGTSSTFYGRFRSITNPIIGNHEYATGGLAPGYFDYWDNVPRYYSYDAAGWHFIALDSNCSLVPVCGVGQAQYQWLQNDLATHGNICTIAYFHHPVYNVGPEGPAARMTDMWALLAQYGVDIAMAGHDHNYQRWKPLNGSGAESATGVTQFVAGAGGHGTQQFITSDSRLAIGFDTTPDAFGALRLQLNQHGAGYQYINTAGTLLDSGSVRCSGAPADTVIPGTPTNLNATASSSQAVNLTWRASIDNVGVVGYDIYRDGILQASVPPVTSFTDTTVAPDTTYSYVIRARDAAGRESNPSSRATVTTPGLATGPVTFVTVADTYVRSSLPASNFGTINTLRADASPVDRSYLRFNVEGMAGTVVRATLRIFTSNTSSIGFQVFRVSDNAWGETTTTYENAPALGDLLGSSGATTANSWKTVDITPYIVGNGIYSIALGTTSTGGMAFSSREAGANAPQLIVETQAGPAPTPVPTMTPPPSSSLPGTPVLISPGGNIGTNYNPTYRWQPVTGATSYTLWVDGPSGNVLVQSYSSADANCSNTACSVTPSTVLGGGNHAWAVQASNNVGPGPWSAGKTFSTSLPSLPGAATLRTPSGNIGANYNPTYIWDEVAGATSYTLWVDGPSGNVLVQSYSSANANCNGTRCSVTPGNILGGGNHAWTVRASNSAGFGPWSPAKTFSTSPPSLPGAATLVSPNGNIGSNHNPTYIWNEVSGATTYTLWVDGPSGNVLVQSYSSASANCNGTRCSVKPGVILAGGSHAWAVRASSPAGFGPWSIAMNFSVAAP